MIIKNQRAAAKTKKSNSSPSVLNSDKIRPGNLKRHKVQNRCLTKLQKENQSSFDDKIIASTKEQTSAPSKQDLELKMLKSLRKHIPSTPIFKSLTKNN